MTGLADRPTAWLIDHLAALRGYHAAVAPERLYTDDDGPLSRSIGALKAELESRLEDR
jgi:hypothetical protein